MKEKQKGRICEIAAGSWTQNKFMSMGIYVGKEITKVSHFALRGAVTIKAGRTVLALGHGMAAKINVELE